MVGTKSIITARDKEIAKLKAALEESENKYYNMGFNDAENSVDLIMFKNQKYGFSEGWLAAVMAMGVPEEPWPNTLPRVAPTHNSKPHQS